MKKSLYASLAIGAFLFGCAKSPASPGETAAPAEEAIASTDAAAEPIDGDAASSWIEMTGAWASDGACGDYTQEWRLEAEAFHHHEMHCSIERLEMLQNGVRAIAHCVVEGDNDRVEDAFKFIRRADATLSIINEATDAAIEGLAPCNEDMIP